MGLPRCSFSSWHSGSSIRVFPGVYCSLAQNFPTGMESIPGSLPDGVRPTLG